MRVLVVDTYYPAFLETVYARNPGLERQPYHQQWRTLMDQCFGTADYYSANLQKLGHEAAEVIPNCHPLQSQWAQEHGLTLRYKMQLRTYRGVPVPWLGKDSLYPIMLAQVRAYRPDVIHFQNPGATDVSFLREIRPYVRLITAQIASPIPPRADFSQYDLMLSSFPHYVQRFKEQGLRSAYFNLGFEPKVLEHLKRTKPHDVVFVGGLSRSHSDRIRLLEQLAQRLHVEWWGYGVENLTSDSLLRATYRGPAWALDMYEKLYNARISLNHHLNLAKNYANNMRLYEATGVGALLVTDWKDNLAELFEPGKEIVAYRSSEECCELIRYYLEHEAERSAIAFAGQRRTLREHTYYHRMREFDNLVEPLLTQCP